MEEMLCCSFLHAHSGAVEEIREKMPEEGRLFDLAELFRALGDSTRVRILYALYEHELCVCDIAALLGMTVSAISHQLRILKAAKLVTCRKEGKAVFYALADDHVHTILGVGMTHVFEDDDEGSL